MTVDERLELAEALWSSVEDEGEAPSVLPAWQRQTLDARIEADEMDPEGGAPWSDVKKRILASL